MRTPRVDHLGGLPHAVGDCIAALDVQSTSQTKAPDVHHRPAAKHDGLGGEAAIVTAAWGTGFVELFIGRFLDYIFFLIKLFFLKE